MMNPKGVPITVLITFKGYLPLPFIPVRKHINNVFFARRRLPTDIRGITVFVSLKQRPDFPAHTEKNSAAACGNCYKKLEEHPSKTWV
jgi:hypothetical protein